MIRRSGFAVAVALAGLALVSSLAWAAEFSAEVAITGGGVTTKGVVYKKGKSLRQEMTAGGKRQTIMILNFERKTLWMVDPATKSYLAHPLSAAELAKTEELMKGKMPTGPAAKGFKVKQVGTETVNGYPCEKSRVEDRGMAITFWYSKKLDFALRMEVSGSRGGKKMTTRQEVRNIKERKLPTSLFEVPKGYRQMTMPKATKAPAGGAKQGAPSRGR